MIKNTVVASRTLKSNLTNKLLDMMTSDWFLKVLESNKSNIDYVFRPGPNPEPGPAAFPEERSSLSNKPLQNPASSIVPILLSCP